MTQRELTDLEREAIALMNRNDFEMAAHCWENLLRDQPDWEHGIGTYSLAICYEEMNRLEEAAGLYREALRQEPDNTNFLGGYASFLYLHGNSRDAFELYAKIFRRARASKNVEREKQLTPALLELGRRLGLSESQVREYLT
jgi:tetratricopeptide (TPR) repeat protein